MPRQCRPRRAVPRLSLPPPLTPLQEVKKARSFRKFTYRGVDLDQLLDLGTDELVQLFSARSRRWCAVGRVTARESLWRRRRRRRVRARASSPTLGRAEWRLVCCAPADAAPPAARHQWGLALGGTPASAAASRLIPSVVTV